MKRKPSCAIGGNADWCTTLKNSIEFPQKLKMELPYEQAFLHLGVYCEKSEMMN